MLNITNAQHGEFLEEVMADKEVERIRDEAQRGDEPFAEQQRYALFSGAPLCLGDVSEGLYRFELWSAAALTSESIPQCSAGRHQQPSGQNCLAHALSLGGAQYTN